jgi:hypothetical protein
MGQPNCLTTAPGHCTSTTEFDFRYINRIAPGVDDIARREEALKGIEGKRLTYRRIGEQSHA